MLLGQRTLVIDIGRWELSHNFFPEEKNQTGRIITLEGESRFAHFVYSTKSVIELVESNQECSYKVKIDEEQNKEYVEYGQIGYYEEDALINGALEIKTLLFEQILQGLYNSINRKNLLNINLFGLETDIVSIEGDRWPKKKLLSIIGLELVNYDGPDV